MDLLHATLHFTAFHTTHYEQSHPCGLVRYTMVLHEYRDDLTDEIWKCNIISEDDVELEWIQFLSRCKHKLHLLTQNHSIRQHCHHCAVFHHLLTWYKSTPWQSSPQFQNYLTDNNVLGRQWIFVWWQRCFSARIKAKLHEFGHYFLLPFSVK